MSYQGQDDLPPVTREHRCVVRLLKLCSNHTGHTSPKQALIWLSWSQAFAGGGQHRYRGFMGRKAEGSKPQLMSQRLVARAIAGRSSKFLYGASHVPTRQRPGKESRAWRLLYGEPLVLVVNRLSI